jgi:hypothetical protein
MGRGKLMLDQAQAWRKVAEKLGIDVISPFEFAGDNGVTLSALAVVRSFGAEDGMVVDPDWSVIEPHAKAEGYGYSAIELGPYNEESIIHVLRDWGWSGSSRTKPQWLKAGRQATNHPARTPCLH